MKTLLLKINLALLTILILMTGVSSISAQGIRYVSRGYNFAFRTPKNTHEHVPHEIIFTESFPDTGFIQVSVDEKLPAEQLSEIFSSNGNTDTLMQRLVNKIGVVFVRHKITVLEKNSVKVSGFSGYRILSSIRFPNDVTHRGATFFIPVPEYKRTYIINISAADYDFDRWYKIAEASVYSFEILKYKDK